MHIFFCGTTVGFIYLSLPENPQGSSSWTIRFPSQGQRRTMRGYSTKYLITIPFCWFFLKSDCLHIWVTLSVSLKSLMSLLMVSSVKFSAVEQSSSHCYNRAFGLPDYTLYVSIDINKAKSFTYMDEPFFIKSSINYKTGKSYSARSLYKASKD